MHAFGPPEKAANITGNGLLLNSCFPAKRGPNWLKEKYFLAHSTWITQFSFYNL